MIMNLRVSINSAKFLSSCRTAGISKRAEIHGDTSVKAGGKQSSGYPFHLLILWLGLLFDSEGGGDIFLRNLR
jgi:hypothetical protein